MDINKMAALWARAMAREAGLDENLQAAAKHATAHVIDEWWKLAQKSNTPLDEFKKIYYLTKDAAYEAIMAVIITSSKVGNLDQDILSCLRKDK